MSDNLLDRDLFQLNADTKGNQLGKGSITLLITAQVLLVILVVAGVFFTTKHLRQVALDNLQSHARIQTQSLQDRLDQSLGLLHLNLNNS